MRRRAGAGAAGRRAGRSCARLGRIPARAAVQGRFLTTSREVAVQRCHRAGRRLLGADAAAARPMAPGSWSIAASCRRSMRAQTARAAERAGRRRDRPAAPHRAGRRLPAAQRCRGRSRWYSRDVAAIAQAQGLAGPSRRSSSTPRPRPATAAAWPPVGGLTVIQFHNNHLVYALTWFALAASMAGAMALPGDRRTPSAPRWRGAALMLRPAAAYRARAASQAARTCCS